MPHRATIRAWLVIDFDDDGLSDLPSQASDALHMSTIDASDIDYEILEIVEVKP